LEKFRFIIANITWNDSGWRNIYINPKAGHRYVRKYPGHESLNFDFNKKGLDNDSHIFGYIQWVGYPQKLAENIVIFFYTKNLSNKRNEIIGVYGNVEILDPPIKTHWNGFENNELISNLKTKKELSVLFPIPLNSKEYSKKRLVPQSGFIYIDENLASRIITDEISELKRSSGITKGEFQKFSKIYKFITGRQYELTEISDIQQDDEKEQQELEKLNEIKTKNKEDVIKELNSLGPQSSEQIEVKGKYYKRDNKTITQLKILRNFKCQICGHSIEKKSGDYYIEAAHIQSKSKKGPERPNNIIILCPNHHKEFDFGDRKIIEHTNEKIIFKLNGKKYDVNLTLN